MCGIVGYVGEKNCYPILLNGLKNLEYRGYDSSGIAFNENNNINIYVLNSLRKFSKAPPINRI